MAPNGNVSQPKRKPTENKYLFNVGVIGRKTGLTLPDNGIRDENGMEPLDNLFSSPAKPKGRPKKNANATISSEEDMDVGESTIPEPEAVVLERRASIRMPPRAKSPIKTFLQSPARRNPSLGPVSSPIRGSIVAPRSASVSASVRRRLDFSNAGDENSLEYSESIKKRATSALPVAGKLTKNNQLQPLNQPISSDNIAEAEEPTENGEDSFQMVNGVDDDDFQMVEPDDTGTVGQEEDAEEDVEPEQVVKAAKKGKGKRKSPELDAPEEEPVKKGRRGRPKKAESASIEEGQSQEEQAEEQAEEPQEEESEPRPTKRTRRSLDKAPEAAKKPSGRSKKIVEKAGPAEPVEAAKAAKKASGRPRQSGEASTSSQQKTKGPKPVLAPIAEDADSPAVKRGPPMPRNNRGLVILRRETPTEGTGFKQTRSGRNSFKPLAYWRNETVEYAEDEVTDGNTKFLLPSIKEVVRTDEVDTRKPQKSKSKAKPSKGKKRPDAESEDEEEAEPWEIQPGRIVGEVKDWDPEDPTGENTYSVQEELAFSSRAIITTVVKDKSFKFAKTLTLPFFGSGMLDLRPGDKKKPKYSRKMQMVFFMHYGRVQVTVNGDNSFRIGKGGMFQVPRGNQYSIENDYDQPARIFFAQGCEVDIVEEEATQ